MVFECFISILSILFLACYVNIFFIYFLIFLDVCINGRAFALFLYICINTRTFAHYKRYKPRDSLAVPASVQNSKNGERAHVYAKTKIVDFLTENNGKST